jgi:hypothetical protein
MRAKRLEIALSRGRWLVWPHQRFILKVASQENAQMGFENIN